MTKREMAYEDAPLGGEQAETSRSLTPAEVKARSARLRRHAELLRERAQAALARAQERTTR